MHDKIKQTQLPIKTTIYRKTNRFGKSPLYLLFFMLGVFTTVALTFVVNPALLQTSLQLLIQGLLGLFSNIYTLLGIFGLIIVIFIYITIRYVLLKDRRKEKENITVDIGGTPISMSGLTKEEADRLAEQYKVLNPKVSSEE